MATFRGKDRPETMRALKNGDDDRTNPLEVTAGEEEPLAEEEKKVLDAKRAWAYGWNIA